MKFDLKDLTLTAYIYDDRTAQPRASNLSVLCCIPKSQLQPLLDASLSKVVGCEYKATKDGIVRSLKAFGQFLRWGKLTRLPDDYESWQFLACQFALWYISRDDSKAKLETRSKQWRGVIMPWLAYLMEQGVIPYGVAIPNLKLPDTLGVHGSPQSPTLIGDTPATPTPVTEPAEKAPINKTLAGPVFWHSDAEYLDEIEATLRYRDRQLGSVLDDYWLRLVRDYHSGQQLMGLISEAAWQERLESSDWSEKFESVGNRVQVASVRHPLGGAWALRIMQHELNSSDDQQCLSADALRQHPAFLNKFLNGKKGTPLQLLLEHTALTTEQQAIIPSAQLFNRFLGLLSLSDMAVAMALLIREHANFNSESLAGTRLLNAHGKHYLLMGDNERQIFSVDKPRAKRRKYAALTPRAQRVLRHILRATQPVRELLRRSGNPHWRYLFLGLVTTQHNTPGLGHPARIEPSSLYGTKSGFTLARCYSKLAEVNLVGGTLDFAKIRNTQGVLAWFDEGSVRACARRLGNSERVTIEHYIPKSLLAAWNERIIRRFQNTLIVLAAHEEDYLLDVVDMPTMADLHRFLAQLVYELPAGRSPIADRVAQCFGARYRIEKASGAASDTTSANGHLNLRLKPASLAMLLAYRQWAQKSLSPDELRQPDNSTGLAPQHFIDLAGMVQAAAQSEEVGDKLRASLNIASLQRTYAKAIVQVPELVNRLSRQSLQFPPKEAA